jgi:hypothetical protein
MRFLGRDCVVQGEKADSCRRTAQGLGSRTLFHCGWRHWFMTEVLILVKSGMVKHKDDEAAPTDIAAVLLGVDQPASSSTSQECTRGRGCHHRRYQKRGDTVDRCLSILI